MCQNTTPGKNCTQCKYCECHTGYMVCKIDDNAYTGFEPCKDFRDKDPVKSLIDALVNFEVKA